MKYHPDHMEAARQLLEMQLSMMKGAMALMAGSAQRIVELSLGAAASTKREALGRPQVRVTPAAAPAPAAKPAKTLTDAPLASAVRVAPTRQEYALRLQEDMDSILHAFAMVPDTADRLIRTSALLADRPGTGTEPRARGPARPLSARRPARRASADHAR